MSHRAASETDPNRILLLLLGAVDLLIAALIFVLPFIMGGREAWGHWFLISSAFLLGTAWAAYAAVHGARYSFSWLELLFLAGLAIVWFQVQPQTAETLQHLSPEYERLLPAWASTQTFANGSTQWSTLSFAPVETRHGLWVFLAYSVIGIVVFQRVREPSDCFRLLKWVGLAGVAMTVFGLLQWVTSNDRFFWFYEHPFTEPTVHLKGAFTNRNHFAQFLALSIGPLLWWLVSEVKQLSPGNSAVCTAARGVSRKSRSRSGKRSRTTQISESPQTFDRVLSIPVLALLCAVSVVMLSVLLSLSRGGMVAATVAATIAVVGLWRGFKVGGAMAVVLLGGGLLFLSLFAFADQQEVQTKLDQLLSTDADQIDMGGNRRAIWAADAKVVERFPWLGTGVGSHRDVYTMYMDDYADHAMAEMTHAESSFVQVALETGLIGLGVLALGLLLFLGRLVMGCFRTTNDACRTCTVAVFASAMAAVLHAVADFIWYVPAIVVLSLILVVVGLKAASRNFGSPAASRGLWFPRLGWAIAGGFCIVGLIQVQPDLYARIQGESHWYASLRTALAVEHDNSDGYADLQEGETISLKDVSPPLSSAAQAEYEVASTARALAAQKVYLQERIGHLAASLKAQPNQHRVQLALAEQLLKLFDLLQVNNDNPMPLNMIRDAAIASGFDSAADVREWTLRACGKRIQLVILADSLARKSLAGCPVQGHAYLTLMETQFLNDPTDSMHQALIDQALIVRGYDPRVRFVAGREALMSGDQKTALELWTSVFHSNQYFRMHVLQLVAPRVPVEFFLHQFAPNTEELRDLLTVYDNLSRERDSSAILQQLCIVIPEEATGIENEDERLDAMMFAYSSARRLNDLDKAIELLTSVITDFPFAFEPRYHLAMTLVELERPDEAMEHLKWCNEQDPGNIWVPKLIRRARKQLLALPDEAGNRLTQR